ncbi:MAG: asparagine synthase (glutamine-hydrolyzing) [Micavibrio aeruginosavorus]|uniref:asparagine synthase (glutamine-hydrolyzing) n=1 Tax=Micavibrio aeruginosavorus TaxID=349221 RepID=A0A2W5BVS7_9BACT|nr:MAG: asparagine synthase (glutamine-hydrolyzing) [Micavibrio aeruginosavorus]
MCGIAGFFNIKGGQDRQGMAAAGSAMNRAIAHRGPDSNDVWQDPDLPLVIAQGRLAIIDLSVKGLQPMPSHSGRYMIVYNGEVYNFPDLMAQLEGLGHSFNGHSDTEVLLTAIEQWGLNQALQKINGMFAFALWDRQEKQLHLVRDRFGKKPLYVGWSGGAMLFASELKAFHAYPDFTPELNRDTLALYMRFGYVCAPQSIYRNVWQLLPGGRISLHLPTLAHGGDLSKIMERYWSLPRIVEDARAHPVRTGEQDMMDEFERKLSKAVAQRMVSDVPLGAFLSGGIDSSIVVALMQQNATAPVKTFSIGFREDGYDESAYAAKIAAHLGTDHHEFIVGADDAMGVIPKLPDMFDEPFADFSQIPTHMIAAMAKKHVTVALTGDGGDEILGGYQRHTHIPALWNKLGWMPAAAREKAGALLRKIPQQTFDRLNPAYPQFGRRIHRAAQVMAARDAKDLYRSLVELWPVETGLVKGASMPLIPLDDPALWPPGLNLSEEMIYADTLSYRPDDLMVKTDRAAMAVALETRAPLMDYELCEYSWRLPHDMKIRGLEGKWLLRRLLERHVPRAMFDRPKTGFGIPLAQWLKGPLKGWASDLLSPDRIRAQGLLDETLVTARWKDFLDGRAANANANDIWAVLMFQSWHDRWMK